MSVHVSSWVWANAEAKGNALLVLLAMADMANDDGVCWPSQGSLAVRTRLSLPTVKRMVQRLREDGLIVADVSLGRSNVYQVVWPGVAQSDTGINLIPSSRVSQGVAQSDPGGSSTVSYRNVINHQEPSEARARARTREGDEPVLPKGTRDRRPLPRPFVVDAEMRSWAAEVVPSVDVDAVTSEFVAYWREGEGKGKGKKNWVLTWRNWLKKDHDRAVARGWSADPWEGKKVIRGGRVVD